MSGTDVYYYLQRGKRLERPSRCPSSTYQIMLKCWQWDEKDRPTFSELLHLLKKSPNYRDSSKTNLMTTTLSRKKTLKATLSTSTLTDENNEGKNDGHDNEQYEINGNGHVSKTIMQMEQAFNKERTNS